MNGKAKTIKQRQSFTKLATLKVPAMRKMSTALKNELQRRMTCRLVMAGSTIRMGGGRRDDVFFLIQGQAVGVQNTLDSTTITPLECGDAFVDYATGVGAIHVKSVIANSNCVVCSLPAEIYKQAIAKNDCGDDNAAWSLVSIFNLMVEVVLGDLGEAKHKRA